MSGKKKWTKTVNKEKREWANVLLAEVAEEIEKNVPRSKLITPAKLSERYKITLTQSRKILEQFVADGRMVRLISDNTLHAYGRLPGEKDDEPQEEQVQAQTKASSKSKGKK